MKFEKLQDFSKLLSCSGVSKIYKVSRNTVFLQCESGRIKGCVKTRHGWLIDPDSVKNLWPVRS